MEVVSFVNSSPIEIVNGGHTFLKGFYQEMDIFLKAYNNKYVLSVHALIVLTIFDS